MSAEPTTTPEFRIPGRTTPTWEMEILLSGATVFALFQVYGTSVDALLWLSDRIGSANLGMATALGIYVQAGLLGLALGFIVHLGLRAAWVAAVGLRSVDPEGRVAESESLGPAQRQLLLARWRALPEAICRLDDLSTLVFALSLGLAKMMALLFLVAGGFMLAALGLQRLFGGPSLELGFLMLFGAAMLPWFAASSADQRARKRSSDAPRWVHRLMRGYSALGITSDRNLALQSFSFHLAGRNRFRIQGVATLLMFSVMAATLLAPAIQRGWLAGSLDGGFPALRAGDHGVLRPEHYLDRLEDGRLPRVPALPSRLVRGPYAVLSIPYVPEWHDPALRTCTRSAGAGRWLADAARSRAVLACLAGTQPMLLDGEAVAAEWLWSHDARQERRGFEVMIDLRGRPAGRHDLEVTMPAAARPAPPRGEAPPAEAVWRIPFWT